MTTETLRERLKLLNDSQFPYEKEMMRDHYEQVLRCLIDAVEALEEITQAPGAEGLGREFQAYSIAEKTLAVITESLNEP